MTLKETIKKYKLSADDFVIIHNHDNKQITAGLRDSLRLSEYMNYPVRRVKKCSNHLIQIMINYDRPLPIKYYKEIKQLYLSGQLSLKQYNRMIGLYSYNERER